MSRSDVSAQSETFQAIRERGRPVIRGSNPRGPAQSPFVPAAERLGDQTTDHIWLFRNAGWRWAVCHLVYGGRLVWVGAGIAVGGGVVVGIGSGVGVVIVLGTARVLGDFDSGSRSCSTAWPSGFCQ